MTRWAMTADLNRCVGCQTCTASCKHTNATAPGVQWRKVLDVETGEFPDVQRAFVPVGCMHCDDAPCMDVCPSTATRKRDDGIVTIDYDICIGCSYCAIACPYQARFKVGKQEPAYKGRQMRHETVREDPSRIGVAQKCTFCVDRIDFGLANGLVPGVDPEATPACVNSCIADALQFGDMDDPDSNVSQLLQENSHFLMHEELGTGPGIFYLWDKVGQEKAEPDEMRLVPDPVGLSSISPKLQQSWDWRAAANFIFGGTGTSLFAASAVGAMFGVPGFWPGLLALFLVALGLFCVWLEIGRPWRFLNVVRHARRSWMTREAMVAPPFFLAGLATLFQTSWPLLVIAALLGLAFLYCQARILKAARGIPVWRQAEIVPLIFSTGLAEGLGLFLVFAAFSGPGGFVLQGAALVLIVFVILRHLTWRFYQIGLAEAGAPVKSFEAFDKMPLHLNMRQQIVPVGLIVVGLLFGVLAPILFGLAGIFVVASGWMFKFTLITRAAYDQGYAVNHMPARGAGQSSPGIKPGWIQP